MRHQSIRAVIGFVCGLGLFLAITFGLKSWLPSKVVESAVASQVVLKTTLILVAFGGWKLLLPTRPFSEMGWRRAAWWNRSYGPWFLLAALTMMVGSVVMIFLETTHPIAAKMNILQIILTIWLLSSFSEEIYVRGLIQSWVAHPVESSPVNSALAPSVVSSALLFAALHVPLMWSQAGVKGSLPIVLMMVAVGWACAVLRARTRCLWPAIACHIVANVAGLPGGIIGVILYRVIYGHSPDFIHQVSGSPASR